jgi:hypothetical protein
MEEVSGVAAGAVAAAVFPHNHFVEFDVGNRLSGSLREFVNVLQHEHLVSLCSAAARLDNVAQTCRFLRHGARRGQGTWGNPWSIEDYEATEWRGRASG